MTIMGEDSPRILRRTSFENTSSGISKFIDNVRKWNYLPAVAVCEATANYYLLMHDMLEDAGIDTKVANPYRTKIVSEANFKNDKVDSENLANLLRLNALAECFVPPKKYRDLRETVRSRQGLNHNIGVHRNRIAAILAKYTHTPPQGGPYTAAGIEWLKAISVREGDRLAIDAHMDAIATLKSHVDKMGRKIAEKAMDDDRARLLMTIPGVGHILATTILAEMVDVKRFPGPENLVSYAGLAPSHRNSGETVRYGGINKRGSSWLRTAMVEAAFIATRYDPHMAKIHARIANRRGTMKARVAVARRMLEAVWQMLSKNEPYRWQNEDMVQRKYQRVDRIIRCGG